MPGLGAAHIQALSRNGSERGWGLQDLDHLSASRANCFGGYSLARAIERREQQDWLAAKLQAQTTRIVLMCRSPNLFADQHAPVFISPRDFEASPAILQQTVFLCDEEGAAYFALEVTEEAALAQAAQRVGEFADLKARAPLLPARGVANGGAIPPGEVALGSLDCAPAHLGLA